MKKSCSSTTPWSSADTTIGALGTLTPIVGEDDVERADDDDVVVDELRLDRDRHRLRDAVDRQLTGRRRADRFAISGGRAELDRLGEHERRRRELVGGEADCTLSLRRLSFVVIAVMSASIVTSVTVVPSISSVPVTSGVRPTAVVEPISDNSSSTRNPTKVPEIVGSLAILAALGLVSWWVVHLGIRPVKRMTEAAAQIAAGDLSVRVPETAAGTESGGLAESEPGQGTTVRLTMPLAGQSRRSGNPNSGNIRATSR